MNSASILVGIQELAPADVRSLLTQLCSKPRTLTLTPRVGQSTYQPRQAPGH